MGNLRKSFVRFCKRSEEMVKTQKFYTVFSKNTPRKFMRLLNKGFKVVTKEKLGKYLSFPMDVTGHSLSIFQNLPKKIVRKIFAWQFSVLSQAGKFLLNYSILIAYASHVMATYIIPKKILAKVTSIILRFW